MANGEETSKLEIGPAEDFPSASNEVAEEHIGRYPVDSQFYGLEPSLGKALVEMGDETNQYAIPDINMPEAKRREYENKGRIFRFFKKETDLMLNRDGDVIRLRNKAEREGAKNLSTSEATLLVNRLKTIMERAWRATEAKFGDAIPDNWEKKMENAMGPDRDLGLVSAMKKKGGILETSGVLQRDKGLDLASTTKQIDYVKKGFAGRGPASMIRKDIREQKKIIKEQNEISAEDDKEPTEKAA
ncbi:MAG: hypothetical protein ABIH38_03290 [Patescibacteria group bacterium]